MSLTPEAVQCPFCQQKNQCGANSPSACWCMPLTIPAQLLELVPEPDKARACICSSCIIAFQSDPDAFVRLYGGRVDDA